MLERHPDGVGKKWFLQKDALPEETPAWVTTQQIWSPSRDEGSRYISYHVGADRDQLLHFAQLCTTTLHTWATTVDAPDLADTLILDLDPFDVRSRLFSKSRWSRNRCWTSYSSAAI